MVQFGCDTFSFCVCASYTPNSEPTLTLPYILMCVVVVSRSVSLPLYVHSVKLCFIIVPVTQVAIRDVMPEATVTAFECKCLCHTCITLLLKQEQHQKFTVLCNLLSDLYCVSDW